MSMRGTAVQAGNLLQQKDTMRKVIAQSAKLQGAECDWIEKDHLSISSL